MAKRKNCSSDKKRDNDELSADVAKASVTEGWIIESVGTSVFVSAKNTEPFKQA